MSPAQHHRVLQHLHARGNLGLTQRDVDRTGELHGIHLARAVARLRAEGVTIATEREPPPDGGHARARYVLTDVPEGYARRFALDDRPPDAPPPWPPKESREGRRAKLLLTYLGAALRASGGRITLQPEHMRPPPAITARYDPATGTVTLTATDERSQP